HDAGEPDPPPVLVQPLRKAGLCLRGKYRRTRPPSLTAPVAAHAARDQLAGEPAQPVWRPLGEGGDFVRALDALVQERVQPAEIMHPTPPPAGMSASARQRKCETEPVDLCSCLPASAGGCRSER